MSSLSGSDSDGLSDTDTYSRSNLLPSSKLINVHFSLLFLCFVAEKETINLLHVAKNPRDNVVYLTWTTVTVLICGA